MKINREMLETKVSKYLGTILDLHAFNTAYVHHNQVFISEEFLLGEYDIDHNPPLAIRMNLEIGRWYDYRARKKGCGFISLFQQIMRTSEEHTIKSLERLLREFGEISKGDVVEAYQKKQ